jgi:hypothetical protein
MLKEKAGITTVFLSHELRKQINEEKVSVAYLIEMGFKAHRGEFLTEKTEKLVNRLAEEVSRANKAEEEYRKIKRSVQK